MENSKSNPYNYQESRIPRYRYFFENTKGSNYRIGRENFLNSLNNNISTSLSSYEKNNEKNNNYLIQPTQENNILNSSKNISRSRSPCLCGCHSNEESVHIPEYHLIPIYHHNKYPTHSQYTNSIITKNEEMNKKNDDLLNEIIYLKRNLERVENELNRTKNEKDASDFYIKELEKELSRLNINNLLNDSKKRGINSVKMRDFGRYHEMLNKSFEVLDSVSNQCNDERGKTKGGVNYYFDRNQDYSMVIDSQKKWLDNLPKDLNKTFQSQNNDVNNIYGTLNERGKFDSNRFNYREYPDDNSRLNEFKYNNNYINIKDENNNERSQFDENSNTNNSFIKKDNSIPSSYHLNYDNKGNNKRNISPYSSNSFPHQIKQKTNSMINDKNNKNIPKNNINKSPGLNMQKNNNQIPYPKKKNSNEKEYKNINNQNQSYIPTNKNKNGNKNNPNKNDEINNKKNGENENENQDKIKDILNRRYLIVDKDGNPILIEGNRLLGMEIIPIIGEDGKEALDENGNIIFYGPDGEPKTQDDLEPIILDNDLPLVNEENKPFLGINGVALVNKYGNPIVGPGELYDKDNKVVHGELGILPSDKNGHLIKLNINGNPIEEEENSEDLSNNNDKENNNEDKNIEDNNNKENNYIYDNNNNDDNNEKKYNNEDIINNKENEGNNYIYGDEEEENNNDYNKDNNNYKEDNNSPNEKKNKIDNKKYDNKNVSKNKDKPYGNNNANRIKDNNKLIMPYDDNKKNKHYDKIKINKPYNNNKVNRPNDKYNKINKPGNKDNKIKIKPLIGSDGRPVIDKNNYPIMLDENNKPVKGTGITVLLDQSGMPMLNSRGEPILINKDGQPLNLIDQKDIDKNVPKIYYPILNKNYIKKKEIKNKKRYKNDNINDDKETGRFNNNPYYDGRNKEYAYPKPNPNYQRKLNYRPIRDTNYNLKEYASSCFACDVGCSVSRSGYSPMTYSPYNNKIRRREITPLKDQI